MRGTGPTTPTRTKDLERTPATGKTFILLHREGSRLRAGEMTTETDTATEKDVHRLAETNARAAATDDVPKTVPGGTMIAKGRGREIRIVVGTAVGARAEMMG